MQKQIKSPSGDKNKEFTLQPPALPTGGGAIGSADQNFNISGLTGAIEMDIGGLKYNSGQSNGLFGVGFGSPNISGISRRQSDGVPTYNDDFDEFMLMGAVLVPYAPSGTQVIKGGYFKSIENVSIGKSSFTLQQAITTNDINAPEVTHKVYCYRHRHEGEFSKIEHWKQINNNKGKAQQDFWRIIDSSNTIHLYGVNDSDKIRNPDDHTQIYKWLNNESWKPTGQSSIISFTRENSPGTSDAQLYINKACHQHQYPIPQPLSYLDETIRKQIELATPWYFETIYDYGQYDLPPLTQTPYIPVSEWDERKDPHSSFYAGFEIRTLRLCHRVLKFHRFEDALGELPLLRQAHQFHYDETPQLTLLKSTEQISFYYNSEKKYYEYMADVPDEVEYTEFSLSPEPSYWGTITREDNGVLMVGDMFTPVDLHNEGIPGFLYSDGKTRLFYRINWPSLEADNHILKYKQQNANNLIPWHALQPDSSHQFVDMNGNGYLDYVIIDGPQSGYYEYNILTNSWSGFNSFPQLPTETSLYQHYLVDLVGDGCADVVVFMNNDIRFYQNMKDGIFAPGRTVESQGNDLPPNLTNTPDIMFNFASICGDGSAHMVSVTKNSISYWPNLGYGKFGNKVEMTITDQDTVDLGEYFRSDRVYFADLNGDGAADLILTTPEGMQVYMNQAGNSFAAPILIPWHDDIHFDDFNSVYFSDIKGNGTQCAVFCQTHPTVKMWYYDFCNGTKPYLLSKKINNLGLTTSVTHKSSVHYYLQDDYKNTSWVTRAPFPVQVISQVIYEDAISHTTQTSLYEYRNSYWDGTEREFRGFGYCSHKDAMNFDENDPDFSMDSPPSYSKTWYHVGAPNQNPLSRDYEKEYYQGDSQAAKLSDSKVYNFVDVSNPNNFNIKNEIIPDFNDPTWVDSPNGELYREAEMALRGTILRHELYGHDQSDLQDIPYATSETNATVKILQNKGQNKYAIVQVLSREQLNYTYDRNPLDPLYSYEANLSFDKFGETITGCSLAYPRRSSNRNPNYVYYNEQFKLRLTFEATQKESFENASEASTFAKDTDEVYILGIPVESQSYAFAPENDGISLATLLDYKTGTQDSLITYATLQDTLKTTYKSGYGFSFASKNISLLSELVEWDRHFYIYPSQKDPVSTDISYDNHYNPTKNTSDQPFTSYDLGRVSERGLLLPWYNEAVAYDKESISSNFDEIFDQMDKTWNIQNTEEAMLKKGHYIEKDEGEYWWTLTGHTIYQPGSKYFTQIRSYDILGNCNQVTYDPYLIYENSYTDAAGNITQTAQFDYQYLMPTELIDTNQNIHSVLLDARGVVITSSYHGSETVFLKDQTKSAPNFGWTISSENTPSEPNQILYTPDKNSHYIFNIYGPQTESPVQILYQDSSYVLIKNKQVISLTDAQQQAMASVDEWMDNVTTNTDNLISNLTSIAGYTPSDLVAYSHELDGFDAISNFQTYIYDKTGLETVPNIDDVIADMRKYIQNCPAYFYYNIYAWMGTLTKETLRKSTDLQDVEILWNLLIDKNYIGHTGSIYSATRNLISNGKLDLGEYQSYSDEVIQAFNSQPGGQPVSVSTTLTQKTPRIFPEDLRYITNESGQIIPPANWQSLWNDLVSYDHINENGLIQMATWYLQSPDDLTLSNANLTYQNSTWDYIQSISTLLYSVSYSDGSGREVVLKKKVEPNIDCLIYQPDAAENQKVISNTTETIISSRWQTSGHKVYNNKGQIVKTYEPYFINTYECVDYHDFDMSSDQTVKNLAVSPVTYYDPVGRAPYVFSPKGYMQCIHSTPWQEMILDANDCFIDSPYFLENIISPETEGLYYDNQLSTPDRKVLSNPSQYTSNKDNISPQGLAYLKTMHHAWTPAITNMDNRGLSLAEVATDNHQFTYNNFISITDNEDLAKELYSDLVTKGYITQQGYLGLNLTFPPLSLFNKDSANNTGIAFHNDAVAIGFNRLMTNCLLSAAIDKRSLTKAEITAAYQTNSYTFYSLTPFIQDISSDTLCNLLVANDYLTKVDEKGTSYAVNTQTLPLPVLDLSGTPFSDQSNQILKRILTLWSTAMQELTTVSFFDNQGRITSASDPRFVSNNREYYLNLMISR